jgi:hypothetical protein
MTLYFTIAIPKIYDQKRAWQKSLGMLKLDNLYDSVIYTEPPWLTETPNNWRKTVQSRGGISHRTKLKKEFKTKSGRTNRVPFSSSGSLISSAHIAAQNSEFNIKCFCKIFSDLSKQEIVKFLLILNSFTLALMLPNKAALSGCNKEEKFTMRHFLTDKNATWLYPCSFSEFGVDKMF